MVILGLYSDNGKQMETATILGLYWGNGQQNGN